MARLWTAAIFGLAVGAAGSVFALTSTGLDLEEDVGLKWLFSIRGPIDPPAEVVVVSVDEAAANRIETTKKLSDWENCLAIARHPETRGWPRCLHARLVDSLVRQDVSVIVYDMEFTSPRSPQRHDFELADAITRAERVVLFERLDKLYPEEVLTSPIPPLRNAAFGLGPFPLPTVPYRVNQFWALMNGSNTPTLPAVALQIYALPYFEAFASHLQRAGIRVPDSLPSSGADIKRADELRRIMRVLRRTIKEDSQSSMLLRKSLAAESDEAWTDGERKILNALLNLYGGDFSYNLNFYGPTGTVRTISAREILLAEEPISPTDQFDLAGKAVFVGVTGSASNQPDRHLTVFRNDKGIDLSGVEIAATAFGNLLTGRSLHALKYLTMISIIAVFGGVVGILIYLLPGVPGVAAASASGALYFVSAQYMFAHNDLWLPLTTPILVQLPSVLIVGMIVHYRYAIDKIFLLAPKTIAEKIIRGTTDTRTTNHVHGICLATDAQDYSVVAKKLEPMKLQILMGEYFAVLRRAVERHGGESPDISADSMMCVWGFESGRVIGQDFSIVRAISNLVKGQYQGKRAGSMSLQACSAALEIQQAVHEFNIRHKDRELPTRIGLHAGPVVVGDIGGEGRLVFSLVGDTPNVASRMEGLNKRLGTQILATEPVVAGVDGLLLRRLGTYRLPRRDEPVTAFEVICSQEDATHDQIDLCERFARALRLFEAISWSEAADQFGSICSQYPQDGPSKFLLERCHEYSRTQQKRDSVIDIYTK